MEINDIVVIDDEDMIRVNLEAFLEDEGYNVVAISNGEDAINFFEKTSKKIDLAIIDVRLPGIDGSEVALIINKISPDTICIMHTGSSEYVLPQELCDIGMTEDQVIFKPLVEMQVLLDLMNDLASKC